MRLLQKTLTIPTRRPRSVADIHDLRRHWERVRRQRRLEPGSVHIALFLPNGLPLHRMVVLSGLHGAPDRASSDGVGKIVA
ncbi:MAG: hypothetical protein QM621_08795 [Aeromicrobium sp.]|uniref:hypothetical protein n=1 Tax=Aeromicrobium sp. TaxID=1871063 RepID=UPI0039E673B4